MNIAHHQTEHRYRTIYEMLFRHATVFTDVFYMTIGVIMLAVLSNVNIPMQPVPMTLQTFGVFLIAFFFGARKGALTIGMYILAGLVGFGVFSSYGSGLDVFFTAAGFAPTGGYIIGGFLVGAYVVGRLIEKGYGRSAFSVLGCVLVGNIIIYAFGLPWLWLAFPEESLMQILQWGLFPFLVGDTIKMIAAASLFPLAWKAGSKVRQ